MNIDDLPIFVVSTVREDSPELTGTVSRWCWVGEGHFGYLWLGGDNFIKGKFCNASRHSKAVSFAFDDLDSAPEIKCGESVRYFDGYWGERALLALDSSLEWQEMLFKARDAVKTFHDVTKEEVPGGWDHEHCAICWATISETENQGFMKSSQEDSVCLACFRNYVERRSIYFITGG